MKWRRLKLFSVKLAPVNNSSNHSCVRQPEFMNWYPHQTVAVIVEQPQTQGAQSLERRFLMVEELINGQQVFNQPAGHLDPGETLLQAAVREALEETAWQVELTGFLGLYQYISPENNECYIRSCFSADAIEYCAERTLDKDITAAHWMTLEEIRAKGVLLRSPVVLTVLEDYCSGQMYPLSLVKVL
jgi:8-oxo-dGTP pyrophosphatase MutT (NUDIX family)